MTGAGAGARAGTGAEAGVAAGAGVPRLLVVTDGRLTGGRPLLEVVAAAVDGGLRAVLVRDKHLDRRHRRRLVEGAVALLHPVGGLVLVSSDAGLGGDGVHLAAADPFPVAPAPSGRATPPGLPVGMVGMVGMVGRSCHSAGDLAAAAAEGCRYATLSPIFPSPTKPGYGPALGTGALGGHPIPVLALGGVQAGNAADCLAAGAHGIAVMGAVMAAADPAAAVAALLASCAGAGAEAEAG